MSGDVLERLAEDKVGVREQPITRKMMYGKLRRYKCRVCGKLFKDYFLPEEKRMCPRCLRNENQES